MNILILSISILIFNNELFLVIFRKLRLFEIFINI